MDPFGGHNSFNDEKKKSRYVKLSVSPHTRTTLNQTRFGVNKSFK